ncbi:MAG: class I SAM-dependent methyltransferase [Bacteroidales bacterium]|nr:class I SAM-dependent methyltransferase [Bacteroidales bacterium]
MSNVKDAYRAWSEIYDTNQNKTRDLEGIALREVLNDLRFDHCLEIGCGTGKNTVWLTEKAKHTLSVDLSEEMLLQAKQKNQDKNVDFLLADINNDWTFTSDTFDLISFSLVLEHIENLDHVFREAARKLNRGGYLYLGELHPFKQYGGTKARFETDEGMMVVDCFNHHISDFIKAAEKYGLHLQALQEFFDENDRSGTPRILTLLFVNN